MLRGDIDDEQMFHSGNALKCAEVAIAAECGRSMYRIYGFMDYCTRGMAVDDFINSASTLRLRGSVRELLCADEIYG